MKIKKIEFDEERFIIKADFEHNNKLGSFVYEYFGDDTGINECDYDEDLEEEDIYAEIHEVIRQNIKSEVKIWFKGKRVKTKGIKLKWII